MRWMTFLLPLVACGDEPHTDTAGEDPAEHACELVEEPGTALDGGVALDETAPAMELEVPYDVGLDSAGPVYVRVESGEDTAALLWTDTADVIGAVYHDGAEAVLPTPSPNELCGDAIPEHFELDLEPGTWHIELGPAAVDSAWILLNEAAGHAVHEER